MVVGMCVEKDTISTMNYTFIMLLFIYYKLIVPTYKIEHFSKQISNKKVFFSEMILRGSVPICKTPFNF